LGGKRECFWLIVRFEGNRAINPGAVEGQIQGGVVQGLGYSLFEEMVWDGGRLANPSFMDYKIPGSLDVPPNITSIIIENPESTHPFGAKGIGEPPIVGVAPAVANAVSHAAGVRVQTATRDAGTGAARSSQKAISGSLTRSWDAGNSTRSGFCSTITVVTRGT
jgi:xanthine dehydrogenase molybdopterin-binding subunit B